MTAANHFDNLPEPPPGTYEYGAHRYLYKPLLFVRLKDGRIAVGSGLGSRDLREIVDPATIEGLQRLLDIVKEAADNRTATPAEERLSLGTLLDLDDITLGDI